MFDAGKRLRDAPSSPTVSRLPLSPTKALQPGNTHDSI